MRRALVLLGMLAAITAPAGCGGSGPGARTPVVVDTDLSTDDVVALLYLAQRPDVDLRAVAVSGTGLAHCPPGARHVLDLLAAAGRTDVPVACGRAEPLSGYNQFPAEWRNAADGFFGLPLASSGRKADARGGAALLAQAVESSPRKATVLSLAPLTDTALLLRDEKARSRVARVVAMGGALGAPGNIGPGHEHAEYNIWVDPKAAQDVVGSGVPLTLVPLDATNEVPVTPLFADALAPRHYATPAAALAWQLFEQTRMYDGRQYFWDPLAAAAVVQPQPLRLAEKRVRVDAAGRVVETPGGAKVQVAVGADRRAFESNLLRALLGGPAPAPRLTAGGGIVYDGSAVRFDGPRKVGSGQGVTDVVNESGDEVAVTVGTLLEGKTTADLRHFVDGLDGQFRAPSWFAADTAGTLPPHVATTWLLTVAPGPKAIVVTAAGRPGATVAGGVTAVAAQ